MTKLDEIVEELKAQIQIELNSLNFENTIEFNVNSFDKSLLENLNFAGIYLFEIKRDLKLNYNDWSLMFKEEFRGKNKEFLKKFTPNIIESRIKTHKDEDEWIPFYLGKSKKISERIDKHLYSRLGIPPWALKLNSRPDLMKYQFRLKTLKIDVKNYDFIVPFIEKTIRQNIKPIVGRQ